ncbi:DUF3108 domain-containing protein [Xanthobacter sp. DSM 24535]|uniref:DUF3108 domain-containing protein n=1 Tax=Roseixanthobacter psychrophilus TaxID=3119917 RepID=UPI003728A4AE
MTLRGEVNNQHLASADLCHFPAESLHPAKPESHSSAAFARHSSEQQQAAASPDAGPPPFQDPMMTEFASALGRLLRHVRPYAAAALCLGAALPAATGVARADGKLDAKYSLSVGGVEIGRATLVAEATGTNYEIAATGRITGVLRAVSSGKGSVAARGALGLGKVVPQVFAVAAEAGGKAEGVRFAVVNNMVRELAVEPPIKPLPDRVEITDANMTNIIDPMSGAFVYVPGTVDLISAAACDRSIPVFDGRQRYDISLTYLRTEQVKLPKGYTGPAVVCRAAYTPVAGHRPTRYTVKYMQENKEMYVWLVPVAGTRLLAPFKVSVATMIGTALLEATAFETSVKESPVSVNAPKPQ